MTMLIRLACTDRIEHYYALDALFRNLFLKRTNCYTHYYYQNSFGLKQDVQNLVGPALSALHSSNDLILLQHEYLDIVSVKK